VQFLQGSLTILGGHGAEHTSFTGNRIGGLWLHGSGMVTVAGTDIDPNQPDVNDVDMDGNGRGVTFDYAFGGTESVTIRGLHATGNIVGIQAIRDSEVLSVRGSYLADNTQSAVWFSAGGIPPASTLDLGEPAGDLGRNVFAVDKQAATVNTQGALCLNGAGHVMAAGNLFGAIDCGVGGQLTYSASCSGQVDIGGVTLGTTIDVSHCH
jgi:hypothetical protein